MAIDKIMKNLHILQENQNLQQKQIQYEVALKNLTRYEMGDQRKLLHSLIVILTKIQ